MKAYYALVGGTLGAFALGVTACSDDLQPTAPRAGAGLLGGPSVKVAPFSGVIAFPSVTTSEGGLAPQGPAPAWASTVGSNVVMNQDVGFAPQDETPIALDPTNPDRLLSGANDYRNGDAQCGVYGSRDGGATWNDVGTGTLVFPGQAAGDPSTAFNSSGTAFYACLGFTRGPLATATSEIFISSSTDLATITLRGFAVLTIAGDGDATYGYFNDKPFITIDNRAGSPHQGRIYVSWTRYKLRKIGDTYVESPIVLSYSDNGGVTWSSMKAVTPPALNSDQGSVPGVGPNGEVYVVFENFNTPGATNQVMVATSLDGGNTFADPVKVDDVFDLPLLTNTHFRNNSFPSIAICQSGNVYVVWGDYRSGNADVLFSRSTDGAASWELSYVVNSDGSRADQFFPWITMGGDGVVHVAFLQRDDAPGNRLLNTWIATSFDNGSSFDPQVLVSSGPSDPNNDGFNGGFIGDYIGVTGSPGVAHPAWTDTRGLGCMNRTVCFPNADAVTARVTF
jgi:hypothetical protein